MRGGRQIAIVRLTIRSSMLFAWEKEQVIKRYDASRRRGKFNRYLFPIKEEIFVRYFFIKIAQTQLSALISSFTVRLFIVYIREMTFSFKNNVDSSVFAMYYISYVIIVNIKYSEM